MASHQEGDRRVLVLAPTVRDAGITREVLERAGFAVTICQDLPELCHAIESGAGAVLLTDESLKSEGSVAVLSAAIGGQPNWSDLPLVLLASGGADSPVAARALHALHNMLVLDRPVHLPTLVSAVRTSLRSRERQYEIRRHLRDLEQAEETLRMSKQTLALAVKSGQSGTFDWDALNNINVWSDELLALYGLKSEEFGERYEDWLACLVPEDRETGAAAVQRSLETGEFACMFRIRRRDNGEIRWMHGRGEVLFDAAGKPTRLVGINVDITQRRRAEIERDRFFEQSLDMLAIASARSGRWHRVNPAFCRTLGWTEEELLAMPYDDLVHPDDLARSQQATASLAGGKPLTNFENRLRCKDGSYRWIAWNTSPYLAEALLYCVGRDMTEQRQTAEALRASEERYRTLFERMDEGFCTIEVLFDENHNPVDYRFLTVNPAFQRHTGIEHAVGKRIREIVPAHDEHWYQVYGQIALTGQPRRFQNRAEQLNRFYDLYAFRIGAPDERKVAVLFSDITAQKQAEEELRVREERFRKIFEHAATGIAITDWDGRYLQCNAAYARIVGYTEEELRTICFSELIHPSDLDENLEQIGRLKENELPYFHTENRYVHKNGEPVWVEQFVSILHDDTGKAAYLLALVTDATERKRAEEALREDDRRKDEFLATLGHELRNPLAAITMGLRLLRSPNAERHEWVKESLERQTKQLVGLVDDLLDISRITRGKIQLRSEIADLRAIAQSAAESTVDLMAEKRHAFTMSRCEMPLRVLGDPTRLQQIIANLLNNAAKYTNEGGRIELTLERDQEEAVVRVRDNGMGIPADMQESIFDLFGQVDSAIHRPQQGLGIGLSLVKMLVDLHDGSVSIASDGMGQGSEFTVRLPMVAGSDDFGKDAPSGEVVREESLDVLVVEDNRLAAQLLGAVLQEQGHAVRLAENGLRAIELAAQRQPDLVILDIGLPDISGYQVAETLRQELGYEGTLIIAATGYGQANDRERSRRAGVDHHLVKPVEYETLALLAREWRRTARDGRLRADGGRSANVPASASNRHVRILVIDDVRPIARITQRMLEDRGHQVEIAFDGPSGIEAARKFRPGLVLCDLGLPGISGFEVLAALKADPALDRVIVAAVTGHAEDEDKQRTAGAGFDAHLVKPVTPEQLQRLIERAIARHPGDDGTD